MSVKIDKEIENYIKYTYGVIKEDYEDYREEYNDEINRILKQIIVKHTVTEYEKMFMDDSYKIGDIESMKEAFNSFNKVINEYKEEFPMFNSVDEIKVCE